jgi:hypothetical protein
MLTYKPGPGCRPWHRPRDEDWWFAADELEFMAGCRVTLDAMAHLDEPIDFSIRGQLGDDHLLWREPPEVDLV